MWRGPLPRRQHNICRGGLPSFRVCMAPKSTSLPTSIPLRDRCFFFSSRVLDLQERGDVRDVGHSRKCVRGARKQLRAKKKDISTNSLVHVQQSVATRNQPCFVPPRDSSVSAGASQCHRDGTLTAEHSSAGFPVLFFHRLGSRKYSSQSQQADMMSCSLLLCP